MFSSLNVPSVPLIPLSLLPLAHPSMTERENGGISSPVLRLGCVIPKAVVYLSQHWVSVSGEEFHSIQSG